MKTHRISLIALTAAAALGLAACGSDDAGSGSTTTAASETTTESSAGTSDDSQSEDSPSENSTTEDSTSGDDSSADDTTSDDPTTGDTAAPGAVTLVDFQRIVETAEAEVDGTAYEIDDRDDDGTWEVDVAHGDDRSTEVQVSADGRDVVDTEGDRLEGEDRQGLDAAEITVVEAVAAALDEAEGTLDDVELEAEGGSPFWEVSLHAPSGDDDIEVRVDVTTGEATVQQDD